MEVLVCCLKNADLTNGKTENNYITELSDIKREARLQQGGLYLYILDERMKRSCFDCKSKTNPSTLHSKIELII